MTFDEALDSINNLKFLARKPVDGSINVVVEITDIKDIISELREQYEWSEDYL